MPRLPNPRTLARVAPWANAGLLLLAVVITAMLAYRAHQAATAHRSTAEQALREYSAFAMFQLRNAAAEQLRNQQRLALGPSMRWSVTHADSPFDAEDLAQLVKQQGPVCHCLEGVHFFFRMTLPDSGMDATAHPLATPEALHRLRDTLAALAIDAGSRVDRSVPPTAEGMKIRASPMAYFPTFMPPLSTRLDGRRVTVVSAVTMDGSGRPLVVYGFGIDPTPYLGGAIRRVFETQMLLPAALTRGVPVDSILAVRVFDREEALVYENSSKFEARYGVVDSLEAQQGGLRLNVAINPVMADRLIIGGMPRSNLAQLFGLFSLSAGLLMLVLYQLARQQELIRMRSEFVAGVSHELRTPLTQIRMLAELLRLGKIPSEERRERSLRIIDQEARRLTFLVESILTFSALDVDRVVPALTDVAAEVDEIVAGFEPLASVRNVRVETSLEPGLVASVDRAAMRQMLLNLLDNAVRYGPRGQTVTVVTESLDDLWRLTVEDQGKGVPAGERERIFEPYYRLKRDAGGEVGGSGIGLAVVRRLVEKHGGRVTVSEPASGVGARFTIALPLGGPAAPVRR